MPTIPYAVLGLVWLAGASVFGAPLKQATVTRKQNRVDYGDIAKGEGSLRSAEVNDVIRDSAFLKTGTNSRAELKYADGTLVRVGQNAVFSFDSESRTLSLTDGTMIFAMPKGNGGGTIKTPSLTAAITGTSCKVSVDRIAVLEGSLKLIPGGQIVNAGEFALRDANGNIVVAPFDPASALEGKLMSFNGPLPTVDQITFQSLPPPTIIPDLRRLDILERTQNIPSMIERTNPPAEVPVREPDEEPVAPPPVERPPTNTPPTDGGGGTPPYS